MVRVVIFATLLLLASLRVSASTFPRPPALEPAVSFWVKVYTQISTQQGFIHDDENLSVIYQTVSVSPALTRRQRDQQIAAATQRVKNALNSLGQGKLSAYSATETEVLAAWPLETSSETFALAFQRVRFQLGQPSSVASIVGGQLQAHEYVIRTGDSLWSIARRFKVSTQQLAAWNALSVKKAIQPGQKLKIASAG